MRGLIPAEVLKEIETHTGQPIADLFDLIAGTSTGGIIALGLTKPDSTGVKPEFSASQMSDLYLHEGPKIFPHSIWQEVTSLHGLIDARYPAAGIEEVLARRFGDTMLSKAITEIVIPSYDLTAPGPYFFKREYAANQAEDWDVPMRDVARATSAAPTYFDPAVLKSADGRSQHALVDGGTFANNPTLSAYVDAIRLRETAATRIVVVSIGTGLPPQTPGSGPIPIAASDVGDFGLAKWARPILEVVLDGVPKAVEYQMNVLATADQAGLGYYRLQSDLPTASHALDDASPANCAKLIADAATLIADNADTLQKIYADLAC